MPRQEPKTKDVIALFNNPSLPCRFDEFKKLTLHAYELNDNTAADELIQSYWRLTIRFDNHVRSKMVLVEFDRMAACLGWTKKAF